MYLKVAPEVRRALQGGRPIVALESTIITHGMPFPENLETARSLESQVRAGGAVPATIAVMGGVICAGLSDTELEWLATAKNVLKLSRNDLPYALATKKIGATTVAATMICAQLAGIKVFATGGIGGVHRGADVSFDISADLEELARTPVAVVCAGAKALLDLPKTLEYLETRGVPVIGYGTDEFPAFWSRRSGLKAPLRLDSPAEVARFLKVKWELNLGGGVIILQPSARGRRDSGARHARLHRFGSPGGRRIRHQGEGGDAVHSGADCRTFRRPQPAHQHCAGAIQRTPGSGDCRGHAFVGRHLQ